MSNFWKKFHTTKKSSQSSDIPSADTFVSNSHIHVNNEPISQADEEPYIDSTYSASQDPLLVKSQIIQKFDLLLKGWSQFPYFIEFLEVYEIDHYAKCWSECDKFRVLFPSASNENIERDQLERSNIEIYEAKYDIKCEENIEFNFKGAKDKCNLNFLPDLISNINAAAPVTPLPSPEENIEASQKGICDKILQTSINCDKTERQDLSSINIENELIVKFCDTALKQYDSLSMNPSSNEKFHARLHQLAYEIYYKYINIGSCYCINLLEIFKGSLVRSLETGNFTQDLFVPIQEKLYSFLESEYFPKYLESEFFLKQKIEVFTSQQVLLQDVLSCDSAFQYFMEYMEQEESQSLLEFWISVSNFKTHLEEQLEKCISNFEEAQADAMILYDKYFSLQATHKMGFSDKVRFLVECSICQDDDKFFGNCFDIPLRIVLNILEREYLPGYLSSSLHIKFIGELISAMKITSRSRRRTASGSTCLSDESRSSNVGTDKNTTISRKNTLLAMDSSLASGERLLKNIDDSNFAMRIDSMKILDPDSLWRRKNFTKLSCGYVDELGRFESDLQPEPSDKGESKLSKTFKRFAKREEDKVKQDMAYKVAEMIIKDVTNVTLADSDELSSCSSVKSKKMTRPLSYSSDQSFPFHESAYSSPLYFRSMPRSSSDIANLRIASSEREFLKK